MQDPLSVETSKVFRSFTVCTFLHQADMDACIRSPLTAKTKCGERFNIAAPFLWRARYEDYTELRLLPNDDDRS